MEVKVCIYRLMDTPRFLCDMYLGFGCILCDGEFVYCVWVRVPSASFP